MARSPDRRDYKRHERDRNHDRDGYRRRSRSREHRHDHRDHDERRHRDRSYDRHVRDERGDRRRRDHSREGDKKRHRERSPSPVREKHDRHRDSRDRYDDRDRKRPRHDDHSPRPGSSSSSAARFNRDRSPPRYGHRDRTQDEEAKKAERLAKVQRMKQQIGVKTAEGSASPANTSTPLSAVGGTPLSALNDNNRTKDILSPDSTLDHRSTSKKDKLVNSSDVSRRAAAAMARTLGGDIKVPKSTQATSNGNITQNPTAQIQKTNNNTKEPGITGFGLGKMSASKSDKVSARLASGLGDDDEDSEPKKMSKLPATDLFSNNKDKATLLYEDQDQDDEDDENMSRNSTPDEQTFDPNDEAMPDVVAEEDEVDPLDAFMNDLKAPAEQEPDLLSDLRKGGRRAAHLFNDDDGVIMDAIGGRNDKFSLAVKKKKKDMPQVNHDTAQYDDFRKSFYTEPLQLAQMTEEELEILRADLDNITVHGAEVPKPISTFTQGGFGAQILDVIRDLKYEKPSAIQAQALPAIMSGRDTIGIAKTGSGKTMAYLLPMFRHVKDQPPVGNLEGPIALILAPTRELVVQIHRDCKPFLKALRLRAVCAYGGVPISEQIAELKRGAEIVVATPGRMIDLLAANAGRVTNLRRVTYLVMDEADRMFDMGFEPQVSRIMNNIRPNRQTVLFSATFPKNMDALARKALTRPVEILVGGRSVVAPEINQIIEIREQKTKFFRLLELLGDNHKLEDESRSLVFVERQETADDLFKQLTKSGYPVRAVHGGRDQIDRDQNIADFKAGHIPVLVATSVAARGLDVKQLTLVVNFDCPNHNEDYVHRCGRTGRAGNTGTAVTFVTPEQSRFAPFLVHALKESKKEVPEELQRLAEDFKTKVKSGEAKAAHANAGFGGHGIEKLEAARQSARKAENKLLMKNEAGDTAEDEDDKEQRDKQQAQVDKLIANASSSVKAREDATQTASNGGDMDASIAQVLKDAMKVHKTAVPEPTKKAAGNPANKLSAKEKLAAAAAAINNRLGGKGSTAAVEANRGPDAGAFHAILQINDLPQRARWAVTNRSNVVKVLEATGTSITTKGNFYPDGKDPPPGSLPKLYVLVEGDTNDQVETAMLQLTEMLRDGLIQDANSRAQTQQASGRYSVV